MENNSNKDFLEEELSSEENTSIEDINSLNSENTVDTDNNELNTTGNTADNENETASSKATTVKSKRLIQFPLIIAAGILAAAMIAFGVWKIFFDTSIEGTWVWTDSLNTSTADQTDNSVDSGLYITFNSKIVNEDEGYKELIGNQGTIKQIAYYLIEDSEDGTKSLQSSLGLAGNYEVTGNWITGRTLVVTDYYGNEMVFKSASLPNNVLPPVSDEFKADEDILGKWSVNEGQVTYTFNEDGTFTLNQYDSSIVNGTYVVYEDLGKITLTYIGTELSTLDITYSKNGETLVIDNLGYTRVEEN